MQKTGISRQDLFKEIDLPNAWKLPEEPFVYGNWYYPSIAPDYHIEVENNYYSVPWNY